MEGDFLKEKNNITIIRKLQSIKFFVAVFFFGNVIQRKLKNCLTTVKIERAIQRFYHRQSKEWIGNAGKSTNVADATSVIRPNMLYIGTL